MFKKHPEIKATVVDDRHIEYEGETTSLSTLAKEILGWNHLPQGPLHFTYKGEVLAVMRARMESEKK